MIVRLLNTNGVFVSEITVPSYKTFPIGFAHNNKFYKYISTENGVLVYREQN